jgi:phospholipid/cholesterol/gamma-HCH transport system substrate-binding protein
MESRAYALMTGLFVLGLTACVLLWAHWLARTPIARVPYRVVSTIPVAGLNAEAQVRYRGMGVGRVSTIALDDKDPRRILVNIEVDKGIPITKGTYAQLGMEGITGIAYVHLLDDYKNMQPAQPGPDGLVDLPLKPSFFDVISDSAEGMVKDARDVMASVNSLLTPENRKSLAKTLASLEKTSANLEAASERLPATLARADAWLSDENRKLAIGTLEKVNETAQTLPGLSREMQSLVKDGRDLVAQVGRLADEVHGAAGSVREESLPRYNSLAESVDRSSQRFGHLSLQLDRDPQSLIFGRKPGRPGPGEPGFK